MKTHAHRLLGAVALMALLVVALPKSLQGTNPEHGTPLNAAVDNDSAVQHDLAVQNMSAMPLAFTENKGQWDERVLFRANSVGATMWFCKDRIVYQFTRRIPSPSRESGNYEWAVAPCLRGGDM